MSRKEEIEWNNANPDLNQKRYRRFFYLYHLWCLEEPFDYKDRIKQLRKRQISYPSRFKNIKEELSKKLLPPISYHGYKQQEKYEVI